MSHVYFNIVWCIMLGYSFLHFWRDFQLQPYREIRSVEPSHCLCMSVKTSEFKETGDAWTMQLDCLHFPVYWRVGLKWGLSLILEPRSMSSWLTNGRFESSHPDPDVKTDFDFIDKNQNVLLKKKKNFRSDPLGVSDRKLQVQPVEPKCNVRIWLRSTLTWSNSSPLRDFRVLPVWSISLKHSWWNYYLK